MRTRKNRLLCASCAKRKKRGCNASPTKSARDMDMHRSASTPSPRRTPPSRGARLEQPEFYVSTGLPIMNLNGRPAVFSLQDPDRSRSATTSRSSLLQPLGSSIRTATLSGSSTASIRTSRPPRRPVTSPVCREAFSAATTTSPPSRRPLTPAPPFSDRISQPTHSFSSRVFETTDYRSRFEAIDRRHYASFASGALGLGSRTPRSPFSPPAYVLFPPTPKRRTEGDSDDDEESDDAEATGKGRGARYDSSWLKSSLSSPALVQPVM